MLMIDDRPYPRKCTRCGTSMKSSKDSHVGHGWEEWCNDCEESYNKWYNKWIKEGKIKK